MKGACVTADSVSRSLSATAQFLVTTTESYFVQPICISTESQTWNILILYIIMDKITLILFMTT